MLNDTCPASLLQDEPRPHSREQLKLNQIVHPPLLYAYYSLILRAFVSLQMRKISSSLQQPFCWHFLFWQMLSLLWKTVVSGITTKKVNNPLTSAICRTSDFFPNFKVLQLPLAMLSLKGPPIWSICEVRKDQLIDSPVSWLGRSSSLSTFPSSWLSLFLSSAMMVGMDRAGDSLRITLATLLRNLNSTWYLCSVLGYSVLISGSCGKVV